VGTRRLVLPSTLLVPIRALTFEVLVGCASLDLRRGWYSKTCPIATDLRRGWHL